MSSCSWDRVHLPDREYSNHGRNERFWDSTVKCFPACTKPEVPTQHCKTRTQVKVEYIKEDILVVKIYNINRALVFETYIIKS